MSDPPESPRSDDPDLTRTDGNTERDDAAAPTESQPKQRLGDFEILRELGRGGMGIVYEARQISLKRRVALKVLPPALGLSAQARKRFEREAQAAAKLHHTNIVPVHAIGEADGHHFYAMDLIEGQSLDHVLSDLAHEGSNPLLEATVNQTVSELHPEKSGSSRDSMSTSLSDTSAGGREWFDTVAKLLSEVADGLHYAHGRGIIHRDIKPANLMLSEEGHVCVTDFGLARVLQEPGMTVSGSFLGTPSYMSPEQIAAGRIKVDHRTDIYSLGAVLYEMLTLRRPFTGESREHVLSAVMTKDPRPPRRFNGKIPQDLETICLKALEKDPDRRYATAGELAQDLRQYLHGDLIAARRAGLVRRTSKSIRRHPAASVAVVGVILVTALTILFWNASTTGRTESHGRVVADARYAYEEGRDRAALAMVDRVLAEDQDHLEARLLRANLLAALDHGAEAAQEAEAILAGHPDDWRAHLTLVRAAKFTGNARVSGDVEDHLRAVEELSPGTADAFFARALVTENGHERLRLLDQALKHDPGHVASLLKRITTNMDWFHDYDAAIADAERLIVARPRSVQGRRMKAGALRRKQDYAAALDTINEAIELDPEEQRNFGNRAGIYRATGRPEQGLTDLTHAIELESNATLHTLRSSAYLALGRPDEAIADARKALELNPDDYGAYGSLLGAYQRLEQQDEADQVVEELRAAAAAWEDARARAWARDALSWHFKQVGDHEQAIIEADRAVDADPEYLRARVTRIEVLRALNDKERFEIECDALAELELEEPGLLERRADQLGWACRRWEQAVEYLGRLIDDYPNWADPHLSRGSAYYFLRRYEESLTDLTRAIELNPFFEQAYGNRAVVLGNLQRFEEELADLDRSLELNPRSTVTVNNRANVELRLGRTEAALQSYGNAIELDRTDPFARSNRASLLATLGRCREVQEDLREVEGLVEPVNKFVIAGVHTGGLFWNCPDVYDPAKALSYARESAEADPERRQIITTLGAALYRNGIYEDAREAFLKAGRSAEPDALERFYLAMISWHQGETRQARDHYDEGLAWMNEFSPKNALLIPLRDEAAEVLGIADPPSMPQRR